jgi:phosphohistidine phosphatase
MKKLLLIRHAQANPVNLGTDLLRDLSLKGEKDCEKMSEQLKNQDFLPELVKYSHSNRTKQTTQIFATQLNWSSERLVETKSLYLTDKFTILNEIKSTSDTINSLVIVGHNPGISELCTDLKNNVFCDLPTCALVLFEFNTNSWHNVEGKIGKTLWQSSPNNQN